MAELSETVETPRLRRLVNEGRVVRTPTGHYRARLLSGYLVDEADEFRRYRITLAPRKDPLGRTVPVDALLGPVEVFDNEHREYVEGDVVGVECSSAQRKHGIGPGETFVLVVVCTSWRKGPGWTSGSSPKFPKKPTGRTKKK